MKNPALLSIDSSKQVYHYTSQGGKKFMTFSYAWNKAFKAWRELTIKEWIAPHHKFIAPMAENIGTEKGWDDYCRVMNEVQGWYECTGQPLECLLANSWREYEGRLVVCRNAKGRRCKFYVVRYGKTMPYYAGIREGNKVGKRLDDNAGWHDIQIIESAAPYKAIHERSETQHKTPKPNKPALLSDDDFKRMILERLEALESRVKA